MPCFRPLHPLLLAPVLLVVGCSGTAAPPPSAAVDGDAPAVDPQAATADHSAEAKKAGLPVEMDRIHQQDAQVQVDVSFPRFAAHPGQEDKAAAGLDYGLSSEIRNEVDQTVELAAADKSSGKHGAVRFQLKMDCQVAINNGAFVAVTCSRHSIQREQDEQMKFSDAYLLTEKGAHKLTFQNLLADGASEQLTQRCQAELKKQGAPSIVAGGPVILIEPSWLLDEQGLTIFFPADMVGAEGHQVVIPHAGLGTLLHPAVRSGLEGTRPPDFEAVPAVFVPPKATKKAD